MLSVITRVYNDVWHIENCLNAYYMYVDEIVLIEGAWPTVLEKGIDGYNNIRSSDGTLDKIETFLDTKDFDKKIKFIQLDEQSYSNVSQNSYPDICPVVFWEVTECCEGDYALIIDSDEIYKKEDIVRIKDFIEHNNVSRLSTWAYNLVSVDEYRSDSYGGAMGIGGKIERFGHFNTERHFEGDEFGFPLVVPNVWCFHYSLYKPYKHLKYKLAHRPEIKNHWVLENGKPVFIDGTKILKYIGELPGGYARGEIREQPIYGGIV